MTSAHDIRSLEEVSLAGMPSLCLDAYDGWLVRTAQGHSRRANSVAPLYASSIDVGEKISYCESLYADAGQPAIFKMTPVSTPSNLDDELAARGYHRDTETLVCVRNLEPEPRADATDVEICDHPNRTWLDTWSRLSQRSDGDIFARLLAATPTPAAYVLARTDGAAVGCARATISAGVVGLYDLLVDERYRRRGLATGLTRGRLAWAVAHGARRAMLQVVASNDASRRLQEGLGFVEAYRYWYRIRG